MPPISKTHPWYSLEVVLIDGKITAQFIEPDGTKTTYRFDPDETIELSFKELVEFRIGSIE